LIDRTIIVYKHYLFLFYKGGPVWKPFSIIKAVFSVLGWLLCAILINRDRLYESLKNRDLPPFPEMAEVENNNNVESQDAKKSDGLFFVTDLVNKIRQPANNNDPNKNDAAQSLPTPKTS
jgi:hypothetical protein